MYRIVETDDIQMVANDSSAQFKPVATLENDSGAKIQVAIEEDCYVLMAKQPDNRYIPFSHIFPEAHKVLKELPLLAA